MEVAYTPHPFVRYTYIPPLVAKKGVRGVEMEGVDGEKRCSRRGRKAAMPDDYSGQQRAWRGGGKNYLAIAIKANVTFVYIEP